MMWTVKFRHVIVSSYIVNTMQKVHLIWKEEIFSPLFRRLRYESRTKASLHRMCTIAMKEYDKKPCSWKIKLTSYDKWAFVNPKAEQNPYANQATWDRICVFHRHGFLFVYHKCYIIPPPSPLNIQVVFHAPIVHCQCSVCGIIKFS